MERSKEKSVYCLKITEVITCGRCNKMFELFEVDYNGTYNDTLWSYLMLKSKFCPFCGEEIGFVVRKLACDNMITCFCLFSEFTYGTVVFMFGFMISNVFNEMVFSDIWRLKKNENIISRCR